MAGRITKLTPELAKRIAGLLEDCWWICHAADEVGVPESTLYDWLARGRSGEGTADEEALAEGCARARTKAERRQFAKAEQARADGTDWKWEAWQLERMNPTRYRETRRTEVTGADGGAVKVEDVRGQMLAKLERLAGEADAA